MILAKPARQTDRQTVIQTGRQTDRQTDKQTDRQTFIHGNPKGTVHNDSLTKYSGRRVTGAYKNKKINSVF